MKKYVIDLPQETVNVIERLFYEHQTLQDNINYMIQHYYDVNILESEVFKKYQDNQVKAKIALERMLNKISAEYISEVFNEHRIDWEVDFKRSAIVITQYCDCEVAGYEASL